MYVCVYASKIVASYLMVGKNYISKNTHIVIPGNSLSDAAILADCLSAVAIIWWPGGGESVLLSCMVGVLQSCKIQTILAKNM